MVRIALVDDDRNILTFVSYDFGKPKVFRRSKPINDGQLPRWTQFIKSCPNMAVPGYQNASYGLGWIFAKAAAKPRCRIFPDVQRR